MGTRTILLAATMLAPAVLLGTLTASATDDQPPAKLTEDESAKISEDAYVYGYPLVLMDVTKRVSTAVPKPKGARAPGHSRCDHR